MTLHETRIFVNCDQTNTNKFHFHCWTYCFCPSQSYYVILFRFTSDFTVRPNTEYQTSTRRISTFYQTKRYRPIAQLCWKCHSIAASQPSFPQNIRFKIAFRYRKFYLFLLLKCWPKLRASSENEKYSELRDVALQVCAFSVITIEHKCFHPVSRAPGIPGRSHSRELKRHHSRARFTDFALVSIFWQREAHGIGVYIQGGPKIGT